MAIEKAIHLRKRLILAVSLLLGVFLTAVLGYVLEGWSFGDATYMTVITLFGVGYGEVRPINTVSLRLLTMLLIVGGNTAVIYVISEVVRTVTEGEIVKALGDMRESRKVEGISNHTIICGYGRIGQILARELAANGHPFVVVDLDAERIAQAHAAGFLVIQGSASEEETLIKAGIYRAAALTTVLPQDSLNVFITLTARNLNAKVRIIARGEQPSTEKKLRQAGATEVILPASIGALRIAHSIVRPNLMDFLGSKDGAFGNDLHHLGLEIHEFSLDVHSALVGWNVGELQRKCQGDLMIVAIRRASGEITQSALETAQLEEGDALIGMGRVGIVPAFLKRGVKDTELL